MDAGTIEGKLTLDGADFMSMGEAAKRTIGDLGNSTETEMRRMTREFSHGVEAARGLGDAFDYLSGKGDFTLQSLMELSKVPFALTNPVSAATLAVGLLVKAFQELQHQGDPTKEQLKQIADEMKELRTEADEYYKTIVNGGSQEEAQLNRLAVMKTKHFQDERDQTLSQIQTSKERIDYLQNQHSQWMEVTDEEGDSYVKTSDLISQEEARIRALTAELDKHANAVGGMVHQYKELGDQLKKNREGKGDSGDGLLEDVDADQISLMSGKYSELDSETKKLIESSIRLEEARKDAKPDIKEDVLLNNALEAATRDVGEAMVKTAEEHGKSAQAMHDAERKIVSDLVKLAIAEIFANAGVAGSATAAHDAPIVGPAAIAEGLAASAAIAALTAAIPSFEEGGTVPGPRGAPALVIAHGGEQFLGVDRASSGPASAPGGNRSQTFNVSLNLMGPPPDNFDRWVQDNLLPAIARAAARS